MAEQLEAAGWRIVLTRNSHYKAFCPCGQHMLTMAGTASDHRAGKNLEAQARRALRECPASNTS